MQQFKQYFHEEITRKKNQLTNTDSLAQRLDIIQSLAHNYCYIDAHQAEDYLIQLRNLADAKGNPFAMAQYHILSAFLENQSYKHNWALAHLKKATHIFEEEGFQAPLGEVYLNIGGTYFNLNMTEVAEKWIEKADEIQQLYPDNTFLKARILNRKASIFARKFAYRNSIQLSLEAHSLLENKREDMSIQEYHSLTQIYSNLGSSYIQVEDYKNSIIAYKKAIEISETFNFGRRLAWYYLHLGNAYSSIGKMKKAGRCFKKARTETPQDSSQYAKAGASANLGQLYFIKGSYESALTMYNYAEKIYREHTGLDDDYNFSVLERYRAQLHAELGQKKKATTHYETALELAIKSDNYKQMAAIYKDLAEFYEEEEDFQRAYLYQIQYSEMRDRIVNEEKARALIELEVKYEAEKKERETEFLRLQTTELQLKALRAQMNPHFIFNSLNSIQGYITSGNPERATTFFSKFSRLIRNSLEFSEFNVIPLEEEIRFLKDYLELEKERFKGDFDYSILVQDDVEEDITGIPPMIIQPYVENSIKHGVRNVTDGFVQVSFQLENEESLLCIIEDNGVGRTIASQRQAEYQATTHRSMGTTITQQRLRLFNQASNIQLSTQTIDLKNTEGQSTGTRVEVRIPIMDVDKQYYQ